MCTPQRNRQSEMTSMMSVERLLDYDDGVRSSSPENGKRISFTKFIAGPCLSRLPDDVTYLIIGYLGIADFASVSCIDKAWRARVAWSLRCIKSLRPRPPSRSQCDPGHRLISAFKHCPNIVSLNLHGAGIISPFSIQHVLTEYGAQLEELICTCSVTATKQTLKKVFQSCPSLKILRLTGVETLTDDVSVF